MPTERSHQEDAQARVAEVRAMRQKIPNFVVPTVKGEGRRLVAAAIVPPELIELTAVAMTNNAVVVLGGTPDPDTLRDLVAYADAYGPLADELEALTSFVRHSVLAARNKAGSAALTTYELTRRLAKRPETADLAPLAEAMSRALGRRGRKTKASPPPHETPPAEMAPETPPDEQ
ncbi:MAG TPA: hypothetical protein VJZ76_06230 [Thermoanaerobaculia bacterium]|nr:hypothetical protein [Thermoanaerobaculia bacterium]